MFGKNLIPEIWAKMFSTNQIAAFLRDSKTECISENKQLE